MSERLYRPSNVTEGDMFMDGLCFRCKKEKACQILSDTFIYGITDWISDSGKRHNSRCRYYHNCKGRAGGPTEGVACKICGG